MVHTRDRIVLDQATDTVGLGTLVSTLASHLDIRDLWYQDLYIDTVHLLQVSKDHICQAAVCLC